MLKSDYGILDIDSAVPIGEMLNDLCQKWSRFPDVGVRPPANRERTLLFLNHGLFHKLLMFLVNTEQHYLRYDKGECVLLLGAYSMKLGAVIEKDDLMIIRSALQHIEIHAEVKKQMEKALNEYKSNGEGWDFESSSIGMRLPLADRKSAYRTLDQIGSESNPGRGVPTEEMEDEDKSGEPETSRGELSQISAQLRSCRESLENVVAQLQQGLEQVKRGSEDQEDVDEGEACTKK